MDGYEHKTHNITIIWLNGSFKRQAAQAKKQGSHPRNLGVNSYTCIFVGGGWAKKKGREKVFERGRWMENAKYFPHFKELHEIARKWQENPTYAKRNLACVLCLHMPVCVSYTKQVERSAWEGINACARMRNTQPHWVLFSLFLPPPCQAWVGWRALFTPCPPPFSPCVSLFPYCSSVCSVVWKK